MDIMDPITQVVDGLDKIQSIRDRAKNEMSESDKELSGLYHRVEFGKFNAAEGYNIMREMQTVLRTRRKVKEQFAVADSAFNQTKDWRPKLEKILKKSGEPA